MRHFLRLSISVSMQQMFESFRNNRITSQPKHLPSFHFRKVQRVKELNVENKFTHIKITRIPHTSKRHTSTDDLFPINGPCPLQKRPRRLIPLRPTGKLRAFGILRVKTMQIWLKGRSHAGTAIVYYAANVRACSTVDDSTVARTR
jgi:hypothetical protein